MDNAAIRHLRDQTGVEGVYLQQLYTFGAPHFPLIIPGERTVSHGTHTARNAGQP
ncbi:MAG: hypothetical protein ACUVSX_04400 [Aggregatilineales bacterium]